jgi:hypothetical protein
MISPQTLLIGLGSGLASAVLFYSAARGGILLKLFLFVLTPLPAMIAGLGWGPVAAAAGAVAGALIMALAVSPAFGLGFFFTLGLPAILMADSSAPTAPASTGSAPARCCPPSPSTAASCRSSSPL